MMVKSCLHQHLQDDKSTVIIVLLNPVLMYVHIKYKDGMSIAMKMVEILAYIPYKGERVKERDMAAKFNPCLL